MKTKFKQMLCLTLCLVLALSITGCKKSKDKLYGDYVKSLIGINYLGANENYIKATGANQEDADALYEANAKLLADNIQTYYGVVINDAPELEDEYIELAKHIYSKVNYSIDKVYRGTDSYYVDVIIYPMDIFNQTENDVNTYVDVFNVAVANGSYNEYTLNEYETIFSRGLIDILFEASLAMTYADPVTVTVQIIEENNTYRISDADFLAIDKAIFNLD